MKVPEHTSRPDTFDFIMKSNTYRQSEFVTALVVLPIAGILSPLLVPIPFFIMACVVLFREPIRYWHTRRYQDEEAAALTAMVREAFPGAPAAGPEDLDTLVKLGRVTVDGEDGSRLRLIRSDRIRLRKLRDGYTVRVSFCPTDFGLSEFNQIMESLSHSSPVAVAIRRIEAEELDVPPIQSPLGLSYPGKPDLAITEKSAWLQSTMDEDAAGKKLAEAKEAKRAEARRLDDDKKAVPTRK